MSPRPEKRGDVNVFEPDSTATSGWVNRNTTIKSMIVDRPSVNAKLDTGPDAIQTSTTGGDERDRVGRQDRAPRPRPGSRDRASAGSALAHLVFQSFEEHHERVGGDTDRHDETGDAGEAQREAQLAAAEQARSRRRSATPRPRGWR